MSMKRLISLSRKMKSSRGLWLWFFVHLAVPLLLLFSVFSAGKVRVNTMLFDILPGSFQSRAVMEADLVLGKKNSRDLVILAAAPDFERAKKGAAQLYAEFENSPDFEKTSLYFDLPVMAQFSQFLYNYRFVIAGRETLAKLESGRAEEIAQDALACAFGAFNFIPLTNIENDPFFLAERRMGEFLSSSLLAGGRLSLREDVLAVEEDGIWYVLLRLTLAPHAVSLRAGQNAAEKIFKQDISVAFYFAKKFRR